MTGPAYPKFTGFEPCATIDPDLYFPVKGEPGGVSKKRLKSICETHCDMLVDCREYAIHYIDEGFWGGLSPEERRVIRRERGITRDPSRHTAA